MKKKLVLAYSGGLDTSYCLKKLSKDEVLKNIEKLKKDLFNFRFQKMNSQVSNPAKIGETRKTIARLKTILKGKANA